MSPIGIVAFGAVSALGEGPQAVRAGGVGDPARIAIGRDEEFANAGLANPFVARAHLDFVADPDLRATALLSRALGACAAELDEVRPGWRSERVGLIVGTSSGGMRAAERAFATLAAGGRPTDVEAPTYFGPVARAVRQLGISIDPVLVVLGACASSALALGLARRCLARGACDVALAGGFDDATVFVGAGFEALRATTATPPPRPFRVGRDGMALGEGAAVLALVRDAPRVRAYLAGFGAASDAVHITAPHREGDGLARAARAALDEAGRPNVDLVGAHATATPYNDAAEARALARVLGDAVAREVVVHPFKAQIGHTLGAAGALETLACLSAIECGVLPAAAGEGAIDPATPVRLLQRSVAGRPRVALKLASAFGGANAALVVSADEPPPPRAARPAFVHAAAHLAGEPTLEDLAAATTMTVERLTRTDGLVRRVLGAVALLQRSVGPLAGAGIVVGSALATVETNAAFASRLRARGARAVEPRVFPYTSPNAAAGECSIAFGLTGPGFAVGGGLHAAVEAIAAGALLIEAGDADRVVIVSVDDAGPTGRALGGEHLEAGAVAVLLSADARGGRAQVGQVTLQRGAPVAVLRAPGHLALLPLVSGEVPRAIASASPPDAEGRVELLPR